MRDEELELADRLVRIFENVLFTEEKSIQKGYFSDLSIAEMHTLDAMTQPPCKNVNFTLITWPGKFGY